MLNIDPVMLMYRRSATIESLVRGIISGSSPLLSLKKDDAMHHIWSVSCREVE